MSEGFSERFNTSRETPWFGEVSNRTLRVEDREAAARRALAKVNQERMRRQELAPLSWAEFYEEWKRTHPIEGMSDYDEKLARAMLTYR